MTVQLTVRSVPSEQLALLKHEAAARRTSLNSLLRAAIAAEAEMARRREATARIMNEVDVQRERIAMRLGGYVPSSVDLIRQDRDR